MYDTKWQKSSFSSQGNECVELAAAQPHLLLRESDAPHTVIATTPARLRALLAALKTAAPSP
ncbi:hypothetical protein GCM10010218_34990 [Streptomyces mashuensis]|uniref:DUF397 domain-containing protein n=1 Tax=Streptomyces mashuensis TaxID=33904 RepID=A0A919ECL5_9ACTN|nr:DUF397 domain-containing protein [Streptomyces mashuensis]GHF50450.1 hypothetical protein GCM10010218_34990 [Streptomyces mashuensis]